MPKGTPSPKRLARLQRQMLSAQAKLGIDLITSAGTGYAPLNHVHTIANVTGLQAALNAIPESIDDRVAGLLVEGTNITLTYNDSAGTLTIDAA